MNRPVLASTAVSPAALKTISGFHADLIQSITQTIAKEKVVVIGMAQNPHVKRVRSRLAKEGVSFKYLEYGSYFSQWRQRLAIKLWSGWSTFPQVFVNGVLIGGASDTINALKDGSLKV